MTFKMAVAGGATLMVLLVALLTCPEVRSEGSGGLECRRNCSYLEKGIDLTLIQGVWDTLDFVSGDLYLISLCGDPITAEGCKSSSVCINSSGINNVQVLGPPDTCRVEYRDTSKTLEFSFQYENAPPYRNSYVNISLICGSRAGLPLVVNGAPSRDTDEGGVIIEWVTRAACSSTSTYHDPNDEENKCYTVQNKWSATSGIPADVYDLSPLIKDSNGHQVDTPDYPNLNLVINPCYSIHGVANCNGSTACKLEGGTYVGVSNFTTDARVEIKNNQLQLHYPLNASLYKTLKCVNSQSGLTINFNCPVGDISTVPTLVFVSADHCYHEVVWNTGHACGRSRISSVDCTLPSSDGTQTLFNLTSDPEIIKLRQVNGTEADESFWLRICSKDNRVPDDKCSSKQAKVAQVITNSEKVCHMIGGEKQTLFYADGVLSLLIEGGDPCSDNFHRNTLITFVCDKDAKGTSASNAISYQGEASHCFYTFEWVTPAACLADRPTSDCRLATKKTGTENETYEYDFGQLAVGAVNHVVTVPDASITCIQVNLCGKLVVGNHTNSAEYCLLKHVPADCKDASVCVLFSNGTASPWGTFDTSNPSQVVYASNVILTLKTVDGPACRKDKKRSTVIDFLCRPGSLGFHPHFISMEDDCTYKLEWQTAYACPLSTVSGGSDCQVADPKTGSVFNLNGLKHDKYYSFNTSGYEYQINFCGPAVGTACDTSKDRSKQVGMCQVKFDKSAHTVTGNINTSLQYDGGVLRVVYPNGDVCNQNKRPRNTTVVFECNPDAKQPIFVSVNEITHCQYVVTVQTAEACPIDFKGIDCTYTDPSQDVYDLTSLIKRTDQNWEASTDTEVFVINVCRPLNAPSGGCTSASSVCSYSVDKGVRTFEKSLGRPSTGKLFMDKNKRLMLSYTCVDSTSGSCGVNISFICDEEVSATNGPTFEFMLDGLYHFIWRTPYACPINKSTEEEPTISSCVITDPLTDDIIDFATLRSKDRNLEVNDTKGGKFILNICGPLVNASAVGCGKDAVVCQVISGDKNFSAGVASNSTLSRHQDGTAELVYEGGDDCKHGLKKTVFLFVCPEHGAAESPTYVTGTECVYNFIWPTRLACPPKRMECTAGEDQYDLRTLAETNTIVDMEHTLSKESNLVISLCGPVNVSEDADLRRCPYGTAACWYNTTSVLSLGEVDEGFIVRSDFTVGLELRYTGGTPCRTGGPPSQLLITLVCSEGAEGTPDLSPPDWTSCNFNVRWTTSLACPHKTLTKGCSVQDPFTGQSFNLNNMLNGTTKVSATSTGPEKYIYDVSICGESVTCGKVETNVAGCQTKPDDATFAHVTGLLSNVTVRNQGWGEWLLSFEGGEPCSHNNKQRKTVIHVVCDPSISGVYTFEYLAEDECEYYFRLLISNEAVCHGEHTRESCAVEGYDILALSAQGNMEAAGLWDGSKLFLSVCQPLNLSSPDLAGCKAGASACVVTQDSKIITSYFAPSTPPLTLSGGRGLKFAYQLDKEGKEGTIILEVRCDRSTEYSTPIISDIHGQSYSIYIRSIYGCNKQYLNTLTNYSNTVCSIVNPYNSQTYDLSKILPSTKFPVNGTEGSTVYFDLCGTSVKECGNGIAVCSRSKSGSVTPIAGRNHTLAVASDGALEVDFADRKNCTTPGSSSVYSSVRVTLVCSPYGDTLPVLQPTVSGECAVEIFLPTPELCASATPCHATNSADGSYYDLTPLMATIWEGPVKDSTDHFVMGVCRTMGPTNAVTHNCPPMTGICLNGKDLGHMIGSPYIVNGDQVKLVYSGGDDCIRNNQTEKYSTTVILLCPETGLLGKPILFQNPVNTCNYQVTFVTPDACKIHRMNQDSTVTKQNCVFEVADDIKLNFHALPPQNTLADSVKFTIKPCEQAIITHGSADLKLDFWPGNSTAQPNAALMVFGKEKKTGDVGPCNETVVHVEMICDHSDAANGTLSYFGVDSTDCLYTVSWYTRFACTSTQMACHYHNTNNHYELSSLQSEDHYTARDANSTDVYYINVCSAVKGPGVPAGCAGDSAVCVKRGDGTVEDLASITTQKILLKDHNVMIQFALRNTTSDQFVQIVLKCDANSQTPEYVSPYYFEWSTPYSCKEQPKNQSICSCAVSECSPKTGTAVGVSYTSFNIAKLKYDGDTKNGLEKYSFSPPNKNFSFSLCCKGSTDCKNSSSDNAEPLSMVVDQFVLEDNFLSIRLSGLSNASLSIEVSLQCWPEWNTTEIQYVSMATNNHYALTGITSHCERKLSTSSGPGGGGTAAPSAASSQASVAVVAVAISVIVAVIVGGCLFVVLRNKRRRYVMKGVFLKVFAVKDNGQVKYRALSQEDREETAVLLDMDHQSDGDSDGDGDSASDSESDSEDVKTVTPKLEDQGQELVTDDEMLDL